MSTNDYLLEFLGSKMLVIISVRHKHSFSIDFKESYPTLVSLSVKSFLIIIYEIIQQKLESKNTHLYRSNLNKITRNHENVYHGGS